MCFSATASFSSGVILTTVGIASFIKAKNSAQRVLAGIPLTFAIQQVTEGVLWMSLLHVGWHQWQNMATYLFLVFAQVCWPIYIPLSILLFEQEQRRRHIILLLLACGVILSMYTAYNLYLHPAHAFAEHHHIRYAQDFALPQRWYYGLLYFLPTILAPIISSKKELHWLGYLFFISYALTRVLFHFYEISVWCFFGAIISFIVFFIITRTNKKQYKPASP